MSLSYKIVTFFLGLCFSGFFGHCIVRFTNSRLRNYLSLEEKQPAKLTGALGVIERIIYTLFVFGGAAYYTYAGIFFGLKIAQRLITFSKIEKSEQLKNVGERVNVYFICNILSLAFGILGGILIRYLWAYGPKS